MPTDFALAAYPNPFNPATTVSFSLPEAGTVSVSIYDVAGRLVRTLAAGNYAAGIHPLRFDAGALPSGVYVARMNCGAFTSSQKLLLLK
jgi:hypothetical protein